MIFNWLHSHLSEYFCNLKFILSTLHTNIIANQCNKNIGLHMPSMAAMTNIAVTIIRLNSGVFLHEQLTKAMQYQKE